MKYLTGFAHGPTLIDCQWRQTRILLFDRRIKRLRENGEWGMGGDCQCLDRAWCRFDKSITKHH